MKLFSQGVLHFIFNFYRICSSHNSWTSFNQYNHEMEYHNGVIIIMQPGWYTFTASTRGYPAENKVKIRHTSLWMKILHRRIFIEDPPVARCEDIKSLRLGLLYSLFSQFYLMKVLSPYTSAWRIDQSFIREPLVIVPHWSPIQSISTNST